MKSAELQSHILLPSQSELDQEKKYIELKIKEIGVDKINTATTMAVNVRKNAYKPYSGYMVGASIISKSGDIYASCNAEVVSFSESEHAEGSAITKAISEGEINKSGENFIEAVIVSHPGESGPCGRCRQSIAEHCDNALILDVDGEGNIQAVTSLKTLFFYAFTPSHLKNN